MTVDVHRTQGGGTETAKYFNWLRRHADLAPAKKVRESLLKLLDACDEIEAGTSSYLSGVEASGWLRHVQAMLSTAAVVRHQVLQVTSNNFFVAQGSC